jgi:hypothetical protein
MTLDEAAEYGRQLAENANAKIRADERRIQANLGFIARVALERAELDRPAMPRLSVIDGSKSKEQT